MRRTAFTIRFPGGRQALATVIPRDVDADEVLRRFSLTIPRPTLFISGGAGGMTDESIALTRELVENGIARFAQDYQLTVIDGGTDVGVMQMMGDARLKHDYTFPLIGIAPMHRITYPGSVTRFDREVLNGGHSHFVLIDADEFGAESRFIADLTRHISAGLAPKIGVLINGGAIAEKDVYLATASGEKSQRIPMVILDGSGRKADEIATASRTGQTSSAIIKAIVRGGDIRLVNIADGSQALYDLLAKHFLPS